MKKILQGLLSALLLVSSANAATYQNKTFFAEKPSLMYRGMDWVGHLAEPCHLKEGEIGSRVHVNGFYSQSRDDKAMTEYFGTDATGIVVSGFPEEHDVTDADVLVKTDNSGELGTAKQVIKDHKQFLTAADPRIGLNSLRIDHAPHSSLADTSKPMIGTLVFAPKRTEWGARISWDQSLDMLLKELSLSVCVPVVSVTNTVKLGDILNEQVAKYANADDGVDGGVISDYFTGNLAKKADSVSQDALEKAKFKNGHMNVTGVADIQARLNYRFLHKRRFVASANASVVIPTGNKSTGEFLYEPIYGSNNHWKIGAGLYGRARIFSSKKLTIRASLMADYQYVLRAQEMRTMGIKDVATGSVLAGSHYNVMMKDGVAGVTPGANILTQKLDVTPGHQFSGVAGFHINWKKFTFDVGYNLVYRDAEKVVPSAQWEDDTYAIASTRYDIESSVAGDHINKIGGFSGQTVPNKEGYVGVGPVVKSGESFYQYTSKETGNPVIDVPVESIALHQAVSMGGPVQANGTASELKGRLQGTPGTAGTTNQTASFNIAPEAAATPSQLTHAVVGGIGYKFDTGMPIVLSVGGQYEFAESDTAFSRTGWSAWGKMGVRF